MDSDFVSPESTVTTLLSSSGHLKSSLLPPELNTSFRYRDQEYDSASAALDAYIADFDRSRLNSKSVTGSLILPHSPHCTPRRPKVSTLRNRDVLRESLTDRELDFLNLPVSSIRHRANRDRLSMTTDELLSIPHDGSMPVTHTSAFLQGLLSQSGASSQPCPSSFRPGRRAWDGLSSSHAAPRLNHHHSHPHPTRMPRRSRCRGGPGCPDVPSVNFTSAHRTARSERADPSSLLHIPHWFTSNKSEMGCSGITSVPDLKYPAWIQHCDLSEPPPLTESELWDDHAPRHEAPSWVAGLEEDDPDLIPSETQVDSQLTLRDLRLQFAEQISLLAKRKSSDVMENLFRDNKIESLIQKADQVLNSLSQSSGAAESLPDPVSSAAVSPVNTEELLCSSSHRPSFTHDSAAAAAGGVTEDLTDRGAQAQGSDLHGNSIWKQPGPVEALKQMLFRLQAVEAELQRQQQPSASTLTDRMHAKGTPVKQRPEAELDSCSCGPSLQRALYHLSRLKLLVEEPKEKHREEDEEKDEDEGRYSSSSADGLTCTQEKPS
ncbi:lung adenoma susceptibility protein 2 [Scomber scombrus]|uniref:Lung adenoma susceptibility protein 2 n=1 Tax=Scomber scombrus TaxID=13677 RepID=A0AAV1PQB2_SCOSC